MFEIKKVLNNNAVLVTNDGKDSIFIGTGIGFKMKPREEPDRTKVDKTFVLKEQSTNSFLQLLEDIPIEYASLADDIIVYGKEKILSPLSDAIYISLTDHLFHLIALKKEGITLNNKLFWEVQKFCPIEFSVGEYAISLLEEKTGFMFDQHEATTIAMHFMNAQLNTSENFQDIHLFTQKLNDILSIIRMHNRIDIDENSIAFERFVTHLRFFFKRIEKIEPSENAGNPLLVQVVEKYPKAYETTLLIEKYLKVELYDDEQLYLTLHIQNLIKKSI